jgi:hypothetical protein
MAYKSNFACGSVWVLNSVYNIERGTQNGVFENRVLRRIFGPKRDEVTEGFITLRNEEFPNLYSSPNTSERSGKGG